MYLSASLFTALFAAGQLLSFVNAHVEMKSPIPFRSKFLSPQPANADFSMTSPLLEDGSNFPCKGYHHDSLATQATLNAGSSFLLELDGSATHNGGSCQVSISYDGGENFIVIHSIIGGCPIDTENYTIPIPSDLPSSDRAILAWTWVNHTGNREFYMNCSPVQVVGTSTSFTGPRIFEANIFGAGTCNTVEGVDVVYPNPGKSIHFGGAFTNGNPGPATTLANCAFDQNVNLSTNGGTVSNSSAPDSSSPSSSDPSATSAVSSAAASVPTASSLASTIAADPVNPVASASPSDPTDSSPDPTTDAQDSSPTVEVATTTVIVANATSDAGTSETPSPSESAPESTSTTTSTSSDTTTGGSCTDNGAIHCGPSGTTFYMCSNGELVYMGSVAAGTTCSNGVITRKRSLPPQLHRRKHIRIFN